MIVKFKKLSDTAITPHRAHHKEIWKDVEGYEGIYKVSNIGRVKSLDKEVFNKITGKINLRKGIIRKPQFEGGYHSVILLHEGKSKNFKIHRLVATAFVYKSKECNIVNHLDGNKTNNFYKNLEWTTPKGNVIHAWENGLNHFSEEQRRLQKEKVSIKILGKNLKTGEVVRFNSASEAAREMNMTKGRIRDCCNGLIKKTKGWAWEDLELSDSERGLNGFGSTDCSHTEYTKDGA